MKRVLISLMFVLLFVVGSCANDKKHTFDEDINSSADENSVIDTDTGIDSDSIIEDKDIVIDNDTQDIDTETDADIENDSDIDSDSDVSPDEDLIIPPFCGDKNIDEGEECDDGNKINTDSCKNDCTLNFCGDGYVNSGVEICDSNSKSCSSLGIGTDGVALCNSECSAWLTAGVCSRDQNCTGLPANAEWNTASTINQTWNGSTWQPTTSGIYNTTPSVIECFYKCKENYTWNGSQCIADTRTDQNCTGLPANAEWNIANKITQTWTGSDWAPSTTGIYNTTSSTTECRFKCKTNYTWNSVSLTCVADTKIFTCADKPALNTVWNTVSSYTQTWNGSSWTPADSTTVYNVADSTTSCRYKCAANYTWNGSSSTCVADTKVSICTGLPANAFWNEVSFITQTWTGIDWAPSTTGTHNPTPSTTECRFKCKTNYTWNSVSLTCVADTKIFTCADKPALNTVWNTVSSYTQTWNGSSWTPVDSTTEYNTTASTSSCRFKCAENYTWNSSTSQCNPLKRIKSCSGLPTKGEWNTVSSITQTWTGIDWAPSTTGIYNTTSSTTECRFKCKTNYTWNSVSLTCVADTKIFTCADKPALNTVWNTVSSYTQTWNGSAWFPPDSTTEYNTTANTLSCRFKCITNYIWNGSTCDLIVPRTLCTGQTKCYSGTSEITCPVEGQAFYGQDGQYASMNSCIPRNYTISGPTGSDIVTDNNTGLIWPRNFLTATNPYNWEEAKTYCKGLNYAGQTDWRIPTRKELATLPDYGRSNPAIDTAVFLGTKLSAYWSSLSYVDNAFYAWGVNLGNGGSFYYKKTNDQNIHCVRSDEWNPESTFSESTVSGKVVVTDSRTGLIWQKEYSDMLVWGNALSYCENSTYAGYADWRLPNIEELKTLINDSMSDPASSFPGMPTSYFWSSTSNVGSTNNAWYVNFSGGSVANHNKADLTYARCVR